MNDRQKLHSLYNSPLAICWDCAHFRVFEAGVYTDDTDIYWTSIRCSKGHWNLDDVEKVGEFQQAMLKAEDCPDLKAAEHVNRLMKARGWGSWSVWVLQPNGVSLRGPDLTTPPGFNPNPGLVFSAPDFDQKMRVVEVAQESHKMKIEKKG